MISLCETKIWKKVKICYMDTDSFLVYVKPEDIYAHISKDNEARFDTSNYELDSYNKEKIKK